MSARRPGLRAMLALALALAVAGGCGDEPAPKVTTLTVTGAWARSTPPEATNGVLYLTVTGPSDDVLVGVSVPAAVAAAATSCSPVLPRSSSPATTSR